jgi:hypothetical protein
MRERQVVEGGYATLPFLKPWATSDSESTNARGWMQRMRKDWS